MKKNTYFELDSLYPQVVGFNVVECNNYKYIHKNGNDRQIIAHNFGKKKDETADNGTGIKVTHTSGYTFRSAVLRFIQAGKEIA